MTTVNVQFTDATETTVKAVFANTQDPAIYPNQAALPDTDARYLAFIDPASTAAGKLIAEAQALLAGPVTITSTSTPALNGSYGITAQDQAHVLSEVQSIMLNGTFADGSSTVAWPDASGVVHTFSVAEFKAFATAIGAFVAACYKVLNGSSTSLPSAALTIA
ncbi:MAG: hypothetical protein KGL35_05540 [Bradyrhizobium sp.]|nr:hypothetical protein [Bradyrhizobium sp.]